MRRNTLELYETSLRVPLTEGVSTGVVNAINGDSSLSLTVAVAQLPGELHVTVKHFPFSKYAKSHMDSSQHFAMQSFIEALSLANLNVPALLPLTSFLSLVVGL